MEPIAKIALRAALLGFMALAREAFAAQISWGNKPEIFQGEVIEVRVSGKDLAAVRGRWGKEKAYFYPTAAHGFASLVGADVEAKPGPAKLFLTLINRTGAEQRREIALKIKAKAFQTQSFNVPPQFDQMTPEALEEIRREEAAFAKVFAAPSPERLWEGAFIRPVAQEASPTSFGSRRIINGVPRAPHSGADLAAPTGTEVLASNHGRVALVGNFFFAGTSVVLDHGGGLFTMYFHLSEPKVEEGAMVKKGEVIGWSGASGRVTGPHLHWGARLANARIDPFELIKKVSAPPAQTGRPEWNETEKIYGAERSLP
jgi:murein DD-endopeptidase MepM/ murein hydrolase activator NlpD